MFGIVNAGPNIIKLLQLRYTNVSNKLECSFLAVLSSLV
jgi:hypothetical protein